MESVLKNKLLHSALTLIFLCKNCKTFSALSFFIKAAISTGGNHDCVVMSVSISVFMSMSMSVSISVSMTVYILVPAMSKSVSLSVPMCVSISVSVSVSVSIFKSISASVFVSIGEFCMYAYFNEQLSKTILHCQQIQ